MSEIYFYCIKLEAKKKIYFQYLFHTFLKNVVKYTCNNMSNNLIEKYASTCKHARLLERKGQTQGVS